MAKYFLEVSCINHWKTPAESPDLNPIEMVWNELKVFLSKKIKPSNQAELVFGIKQFWEDFTVKKCIKYIDHIQKVLPIVVKRGGKASGH